jgi:replication factor C large subunit
MTLLLTKYHPNTSTDLVGNKAAQIKLKDFIINYKSQKKSAVILHGPLGTGKTSLVYALARDLDYDILELNSSQQRNKDAIQNFLTSALNQMSLFMRPKIILIDEADNTSGRKDRGGMAELAKIITKSKFPIICTANDVLDKKIKPIKKVSKLIEVHKPNLEETITFLKQICSKENIDFDDKAISALARQSDGDIRAALLELQVLKNQKITLQAVLELDDRKRTQTILHALKIVFKSTTADTARTAFNDVDINPDHILLWMEYNLPNEYLDAKSLQAAFEHLSRADIFKQRIMRWQHWRYLVYIFDLLSAGISTSKQVRNPNKVEYKQSSRLLKMWMAKNKNAKKIEISKKYATTMHTSTKVAMRNLPYLRHIIRHSNPKIKEQFHRELDLTDEEITWLKR